MFSQTVYSRGTYHGLPTFPEHERKKYTALVLGSTGITGAYLVRTLSQSPIWKDIFAVSRKPPSGTFPNHVHHLAIDLLQDPSVISEVLKREGAVPNYVFFAAYIQPPPKPGQGLWSDEAENERINMALLRNLLTSLESLESLPKRILLQTGAKHYGLHLGPPLTPMLETDPRYERHPNFYFAQEDFLWAWCKKHSVSWNVTRPGFIIGAVPAAAMNVAYGLAVYASIQRELGEKLEFPGSITAWDAEKHLSAASLIASHAEWAVLSETTKDQILNVADDSLFTYSKFWPVLAAWYGIEYGVPGKLTNSVTLPATPPPRGFGEPGKVDLAWSFQEWASRPDVQAAWKKLAAKYALTKNPFDQIMDNFGLLDGEITAPWGRSLSVGKSRRLGWHGYVDSHAAIYETIRELSELKMVPPIPNDFDQVIKFHGY